MSPPDASPDSPRWLWLDEWCAPRWRALITWVALAWLSAIVADDLGEEGIASMIQWPVELIQHFAPTALPLFIVPLAVHINFALLLTWFEPVVLRLNPARGALWLGLRILPLLICSLGYEYVGEAPVLATAFWLSAAQAVALRNWRSPPWMPVFSMMLALGMVGATAPIQEKLPAWWWMTALSFLYALPLLYCTRLLSPEERA